VLAVLDKDSIASFYRGFQTGKKQEPDVVHLQHELNLYGRINFLFFVFLLLLWKPFTSTKFVTTLHTYIKHPFRADPKGFLRFVGYRLVTYPLIYAISDRLVVHNQVLADRMGRDDVEVIPHGVKQLDDAEDVRENYGIEEDETFLLCLGFLSDSKGFHHAIEALGQLPDKYRLVIAGSPPPSFEDAGKAYFERLQDLVEEHNLEDRIVLKKEFLPEDEIDSLIHSCDMMLFPYTDSSQSGMMHRAIGAGKPTVCSDLDVFKAVLGDAGTYFEEGNSDDLAHAIDAYEEKGKEITKLKEEMSWSNVAEQHMELYRSLL